MRATYSGIWSLSPPPPAPTHCTLTNLSRSAHEYGEYTDVQLEL